MWFLSVKHTFILYLMHYLGQTLFAEVYASIAFKQFGSGISI